MTMMRLGACVAAVLACLGPGGGAAAQDAGARRATLAFISDTQAPLLPEELRLPPERNTEATAALFGDICRQRPARVFLLGDLVSLGFYDRSWEAVDDFLDSLRTYRVPADAIPGNHELILFPGEGERNFQQRFPLAALTGYTRTVDSVAVVLLNSNFDRLGDERARSQRDWYGRTIDSLDADPSVVAIIVCCHHSPYSNSAVVGSSLPVREQFVPRFLASPKARLFLSGHAHTSEHFRTGGKDFLVIGGGGGLRHPIEGYAWRDLTVEPRPRFHYLLVGRVGIGLRATIRALGGDLHTFRDIDVPLAEPPDRQ
ncbi:MAG TPA: metallophosphoesterase [Bacteroidota bacterium]|nr:metallophosphoesterase [Bacteroidota bacterium]